MELSSHGALLVQHDMVSLVVVEIAWLKFQEETVVVSCYRGLSRTLFSRNMIFELQCVSCNAHHNVPPPDSGT